MEIQVELSRIIINEAVDQQIVVLKELNGDRSFPIVIGINEILAIDRRMKGLDLPRPMTHDLLANMITQTGGKVEKVVISDLKDHTFYAKLHLNYNGKISEIDSRPSDALAIGTGTGAPVFVEERVFDQLEM